MFVPVACSACGKPFQVPESATGKPAACPSCRAAVLALPAPPPLSTAPPSRPRPSPSPSTMKRRPPQLTPSPVHPRAILLIAIVATLATVHA